MKIQIGNLALRALLSSTMLAFGGCVATLPHKPAENLSTNSKPVVQENKAVATSSVAPGAAAPLKQAPDAAASSKLTDMRMLVRDGFMDKAKFCSLSDGFIKRVDARGLVTLKSGKSFRLKMRKDESVDSVQFVSDDTSLTIAFGITAGGDSDAYVCKYQLSNLKPSWCTQVVVLNEAYVSNAGAVYISGFDAIFKIDQATGKTLWTVPSVKATAQFNSSYTTPFEEGNNIVFVSTMESPSTLRKIVFNAQNGRLLSKQVVSAKTFAKDPPQQFEGSCPK
jgi:outer membrane protein assembly factor BamB